MAVVEGAAGERQFSDETVRARAVAELRRRGTGTIDPGLGKAQARVAILPLRVTSRIGVLATSATGAKSVAAL